MDTILKTLTVATLGETQALAQALAPLLKRQDVVLLEGDLGSGKTAFCRALIQTLTSQDEEVPSPTFTLVQTYPTLEEEMVWHFDLYRLKEAEEVWELGIEEAFSEGISLIEWPDRLPYMPSKKRLKITFSMGRCASERSLEITGSADWEGRLEGI